jgi:Zn-dependent metalloprotease
VKSRRGVVSILATAAAVLAFAAATHAAAQDAGTKRFGADPTLDKQRAAALARPYLVRALAERGDTGQASGFVGKRIGIDKLHMAHVRVQQTYRGVPVFGGEAIAHLNPDGSLASVTNNFARNVAVRGAVTPQISSGKAVGLAAAATGLRTASVSVPDAPALVVLPHAGTNTLAWRVRLVHTADTGTPSIPVVFVNARTGVAVWSYDDLETDTGHSHYSGDVTVNSTLSSGIYQLKDGARGNNTATNLNRATSGGGTLFTGADTDWGDGSASTSTSGAAGETAGVDALYDASVTWDYYKNVHGRNGIFNNGVGVPSRVHYGNNYVNAFWDGTQMTYGDGSGNVDPLTELDVGGHEMSHGVTENTAGLIYSGESGGLNEATSDIFGTAVEFYANNASDPGDYLIGEKIDINGNGTPLRYMDKPSKDGGSKDCWYSGIGNIDVHYSSGPANHFYYLLSEGSGAKTINGVSYNSPTCNSSVLTGIGHLKAEQIWYRALTTYFTASTNYASARTGTLSAATDLYGAGSAEYTAVCNTWAAVSVGTACSGVTTALQNGVAVTNLSGAAGASLNYSLAIPSGGASNVSFTLSGGTGDANLYVRFGSAPTTSVYDCASTQAGNGETCSFASANAGTFFVLVYGNTAFSGVTLLGSYAANGSVLQNNVPVTGLSGATGSAMYFTMAVPSGATNLKFTMSGGTGDADMYVKFGSNPTTSTYDCRPYVSGNAETCSFATPQVGTYYVMIRGYSAYSGVTLVGSYTAAGSGNVLTNGVSVSVPATSTGGAVNYTMAVPSGSANLSFRISGGTGDADMYVKFGSAPTTTSYDCRPYVSGNTETCAFAAPSVGTYYVMVRAYASFSGVSLVGSYTTGGGGNVLSNGVPVSLPSTATGGALNYTMSVPSGRTSLSFKISGGTGDADLYVKFGSAPTTTSYTCRPYLSGNSETCTFSAPSAGTWYVMVRAYASFSGVSLVGTYT